MRHLSISCILVDTRNGQAREIFVSISFTLLKLKQSDYADLFVCFALSYLNGRLRPFDKFVCVAFELVSLVTAACHSDSMCQRWRQCGM